MSIKGKRTRKKKAKQETPKTFVPSHVKTRIRIAYLVDSETGEKISKFDSWTDCMNARDRRGKDTCRCEGAWSIVIGDKR